MRQRRASTLAIPQASMGSGSVLLASLAAGLTAGVLAAFLGVTPSLARGHGHQDITPHGFAEPGDIVAADIALNRLARQKGASKAMRRLAAREAIVLMPDGAPQSAALAFHDRTAPAPDALRETYAVWMACDGSAAVSYGRWRSEKPIGEATTKPADKTQGKDPSPSKAMSQGWYVTVWRLTRKHGYRWVFDRYGSSPDGIKQDPPLMIDAQTADCLAGHTAPARLDSKAGPSPKALSGHSHDGTLVWETSPSASLSVQLLRQNAMRMVLTADDHDASLLP